MKRGTSNFNFICGVDKPSGKSSHDVINYMRRALDEGRIGHMGTLDPLATGVLIVGVGSSARLNKYINLQNKEYIVDATFGASTDSLDSDGSIEQVLYPNNEFLNNDWAVKQLKMFEGKYMQTPPNISAIKIHGTPAYKIARSGQKPNMSAREVVIYSIKLVKVFKPGNTKLSSVNLDKLVTWRLIVSCSKGTYVRSLVRDIACKLNTCGHVSSLIRTKVGSINISDCMKLQFLNKSRIKKLNPVNLLNFPCASVENSAYNRMKNGCEISTSNLNFVEFNTFKKQSCLHNENNLVCIIYKSKLIAIYKVINNIASPEIVFNIPIDV